MTVYAGYQDRKCYRLRVLPEPVLARLPQGQLLDAERLQPDWPQAIVLFTDDRWRPATIVATSADGPKRSPRI